MVFKKAFIILSAANAHLLSSTPDDGPHKFQGEVPRSTAVDLSDQD